jgi:hypothetical protein
MRRPLDDESSAAWFGGCVYGYPSHGEVQSSVHVNYAETVLPIRDGLAKFKDFPAEFGGSGEQIAE